MPRIPDEIIEELWRIKDSIAREQGNDEGTAHPPATKERATLRRCAGSDRH